MPARPLVFLFSAFLLLSTSTLGCGGGTSGTQSTGPSTPTGPTSPSTNPKPVLTSIDPASAAAGSNGGIMTLTGSYFLSSSTVEWDNSPVQTLYMNSTTLTAAIPSQDLQTAGMHSVLVSNPAPGGGTSAALNFVVILPSTQIGFYFNLNANDLAWDPVNQLIYLSLSSADGTNGNMVQILDPNKATLGASTFVGSEPNLLAVSKNSKYLYVSLNGASNVQRMTLPNLGTDIKISLGASSIFGPFYAMDLQASPVSDGSVAVVREALGVSPAEEGGVIIYDDATARPNVLCGSTQSGCSNDIVSLFDSIQWNSDGSKVFAADNEDSAFDFYTIAVSPAGFGSITDYTGLVPGFGERIHYDATTGYVYDDDGTIIDPIAGTVVGTFNASGLMVPDGSLGRAFFIGQTQNQRGSANYSVELFDIQRFTPIAMVSLGNLSGVPTHLIRWGNYGLAFTTSASPGSSQTGAVYVIDGSFLSSLADSVPVENVQRTWKLQR